MAGRQRNRLTEKRGLRWPGTFESSNPRTLESGHNIQVVIVASCHGADSMRGFLYPVPALLLQEKQTMLSGAATASAKKSVRSEDLLERATRPIRVRGALYLRMLPFALCCSRRFNSSHCQSRGSPFAAFSICISPVQPVLPDWTTISNYKPRYSANSPGGYFGISMLWMYVI